MAEGGTIGKLKVDDVARLLSQASGRPVSADQVRQDIAAGAPANADGTVNLIQYGAWLVRKLTNGQ